MIMGIDELMMYFKPHDDAGGGASLTDTGAGDDAGGDDQSTGDDGQIDGDGGDKSGEDSKSLVTGIGENEGKQFDFSTGEKPDGFPDEYWDADNNGVNAQSLFEGLQKQEKIAKDLRAKMGRGEHKAPKESSEYKFEPSEKAAEFLKDDDPLVGAARDVAHKHGLSQEQYAGFMSEMMDQMLDVAEKAADPNNEQTKAQLEEYKQKEIEKIGPNGAQVLRVVQSWGNELLSEGVFTQDDVDTLTTEGLVSANMVRMFNRLRSRMGGSDIPVGTINDGLSSDSEIASKVSALYDKGDAQSMREAEELLQKRRDAGRSGPLQF